MTSQRKRELAAWVTIVVGLVTLAATARAWANSAFVSAPRFERDSIARAADHDALIDMRGRVTDIYCATVPLEKRRGCR